MDLSIAPLDIAIIIGYFLLIFYIAYRITMKERSKSASASDDYFLAGRNAGWFVIGASLFASNIGSEHIVGLAGSGARGAMPAAQFEVLASLMLIILGWLFVPFYLKSGVFTMPEFLERRYNAAARTYLSGVSILAYVLTKISLTIFAGALVFEVIGIPFWTGAVIVVIATGLYTVFGGLRAVIYTDMIQLFILLGGAIAVTFFGLNAIGGWDAMMDSLANATAGPDTPSQSDFFNLWRPSGDSDYPWTGMLFGAPILGIWYWCTDQFIVQRVLSAKDISNARKGTIFAGFLKQLPLFIFVIPGIIAFVLAEQGLMQAIASDPDQALPAMITDMLPIGLKGLVLAGLLAALMSSLSSAFNSCSTLITIDFYKKYRPEAGDRELVRFGQLATAVLVLLSLGWIPLMRTLTQGGGIFQYLQSVQAYISPPIAAAFLVGLFMKRINAKGAIWSLWSGFVLGITRLVLEYMTKEGILTVGPDSWVTWFVGINFLHFALFLFIICALIMIGVSYSTAPPPAAKLDGTTYTVGETKLFSGPRSDLYLTLLLIAVVLVIWFVFSPLGMAG